MWNPDLLRRGSRTKAMHPIARRIRRRAPTGGFEAVGRVEAPPRGPGPALGRFGLEIGAFVGFASKGGGREPFRHHWIGFKGTESDIA